MTWSAPRDLTKSRLRVLHTPVTSAPSDRAICTAKLPTPPEAPLIRTRVPRETLPRVCIAASAVRPDITDAAASSKLSASGFEMRLEAGTAVSSANRRPRAPQAGPEPEDVRHAGDRDPIRGVHARRAHPDQRVARAQRGRL